MDFFHSDHLFQKNCFFKIFFISDNFTVYGIVRYKHLNYNGAVLNLAVIKSTLRKLIFVQFNPSLTLRFLSAGLLVIISASFYTDNSVSANIFQIKEINLQIV